MSLAYVIDGYNLLKHPAVAPAVRKASSGRQGTGDEQSALVSLIRARGLCGSARNRLLVVFDGYRPGGTLCQAQDDAVYSCDVSADAYILRLVQESRQPKSVVVVSNDLQIQTACRQAGASVMGIEEFWAKGERTQKPGHTESEVDMGKLSYSEQERINKELRKRWLKG